MLPFRRPSTAPRARRVLAVVAAASASLTLAACTAQDAQTSDLTGEQGVVGDVVQKLSDRADRDDAAGICRELLGAELKKAFGGAACASNVEKAIVNADYTSLTVDTVAIDSAGTTAVAQIKPVESADARRSITLTRKDKSGAWTIAALDPTGKTKLPAEAGTTPTGTTPAETTPASTPKQ